MFASMLSGTESAPTKRDAILVIAYAERIECFIQYLKKQPPGNALEINGADQSTQSHYSINLVVKNVDNADETVEIIYVKYQDNQSFDNLTVGDDVDVKYAFIGGDLCDKEDVQQFLLNCNVLKENVFVTPCAYNIDAAGVDGEADCQKRKFKKTATQRLSNIFSPSDEKTQITSEKNKYGYNVDFFNEIVKDNATKQCTGRPFILLQFPLLICWLYEYGATQIDASDVLTKLKEMFTTSSGISNSLMESLRIPATQMFVDREQFNTSQNGSDTSVQTSETNRSTISSDISSSNSERPSDATSDLGLGSIPDTDQPLSNESIISTPQVVSSEKGEAIQQPQQLSEIPQQLSGIPPQLPEPNLGTQKAQEEENSDEPPALTIPPQTGGDLVGFDSETNNNNCYLNALFQMLCRIKGLKERMVSAFAQNAIPPTREYTSETVVSNPEYEIAKIFQKYNQASLNAQISQTSQTVLLDTNDVIGMKTFALDGVNASDDNQESISDFLTKRTLCLNEEDCIFDDYLEINRDLGGYYLPLSDQNRGQTPSDPYNILENVETAVVEKPYLIFYFVRSVSVENVETKITTKVIADGEIDINRKKYVKKGAIVHLGDTPRSGHYIYISYKQRDDGTYAIDKMYDNSNVIVFNDGQQQFLAPRLPNEKVVQFFEDSMAKLIDKIQGLDEVDQTNKQSLIENFTDAKNTIKGSNALKLSQYEDVKIFFDGIDAQMLEIANVIRLTPGDIVNNFNDKPYANFLEKSVGEIEDLIAQNTVFFLYERVDASPVSIATESSATAGGASTKKKKSWSRSRRAKRHNNNVSLKRLNKMKQESHPSIKKRSTSLKK